MHKVLIIEDEPINAARLRRLILDIDDTLVVDGPLTSVDEVVRHLEAVNDYDLVFADIRLGEQTVFEAFHQTMPRSFVVFTTAYDTYAMEAIRSNGIDYLMKPVDADELAAAMQKVTLARRTDGERDEQTERISHVASALHAWRERLLVCRGDELIPLRTADITYVFRDASQTRVTTTSGETYVVNLTMNELEQNLNPDRFFRLNRQYIANIDYVRKISLFFSSKLLVRIQGCDDDHIVVSRERAARFKEWLDR